MDTMDMPNEHNGCPLCQLQIFGFLSVINNKEDYIWGLPTSNGQKVVYTGNYIKNCHISLIFIYLKFSVNGHNGHNGRPLCPSEWTHSQDMCPLNMSAGVISSIEHNGHNRHNRRSFFQRTPILSNGSILSIGHKGRPLDIHCVYCVQWTIPHQYT